MLVDLTHTIRERMPVYPGTEPPTLKPASSYERDGYRETLLSMFSHTGTHVDAPAHIVKGARVLDDFSADELVGRGVVVDCRDVGCGGVIGMDRLLALGEELRRAEFILFATGWDKLWGTDDYYDGFPVVSPEVLEFIISSDVKGIGFDTISLDPVGDVNLTYHKRLFSEKSIINIENLTGLEGLIGKSFTLYCLPMKFENSDGAPARVIAATE